MSILSAILVSVVSSVISGVIVWFAKDWLKETFNQKIKLQNAPRNLLEYISPGTNIRKVKEILGAPLVKGKFHAVYKFKNVNIQIRFDDNENVKVITMVLPRFGRKVKFPIYPLDFKLGELRLGELDKKGNEFSVDTSSKHGQVWTECYFGNPGYYRYYTFGIFDGPSANYPFDFPKFDTMEQEIYGDFADLKVNFVSVAKEANEGASYGFYALR